MNVKLYIQSSSMLLDSYYAPVRMIAQMVHVVSIAWSIYDAVSIVQPGGCARRKPDHLSSDERTGRQTLLWALIVFCSFCLFFHYHFMPIRWRTKHRLSWSIIDNILQSLAFRHALPVQQYWLSLRLNHLYDSPMQLHPNSIDCSPDYVIDTSES